MDVGEKSVVALFGRPAVFRGLGLASTDCYTRTGLHRRGRSTLRPYISRAGQLLKRC